MFTAAPTRGGSRVYAQAARDFGRELAQQGLGLVYGGSSAGIMGILADAVLENGGRVIRVIPEALVERRNWPIATRPNSTSSPPCTNARR